MSKNINKIKFPITIILFSFSLISISCRDDEKKPIQDVSIEETREEDLNFEMSPDQFEVPDIPTEIEEADISENFDLTEITEEVSDITGDRQEEEITQVCNSIDEVRAGADGDVDFTLCNVYVTYVAPNGYFVQQAQNGPAIQIYEGNAWTPDVSVGDEINMHITGLTTFHGNKEIDAHDPVTIISSGNDITSIVQDLTSGIIPSEDLEAELVRITGAIVTSINGADLYISYGTATDVYMRVSDSGIFCIGAIFSVLAVVTEWSDLSTHRIQSFQNTDFYNIDTSACGGGGRTPQPGELLINEFLYSVPSGMSGDSNCDGSRNGSQDEFIEIVNISADTLNLTGITISDSDRTRHTFSPGTTLLPGKVYVVFGGGTPSCSTWASDVQVTVASEGSLSLHDTGDSITIADSSGNVINSLTYPGGDIRQSLTLNPDLNDTEPAPTVTGGFIQHSTADTIDGSLFSPGTRIDGTAF